MKYIILFFFSMINLGSINAQAKSFYVFDSHSHLPIEAAHFWITNSDIGSFSDHMGHIEFPIPSSDLIVVCTHLSYASLNTKWSTVGDTIWLDPLVNNLGTIELVAKATVKHKRHLRRFESALLGKTKNGKRSSILNPEVLQFDHQNDLLLVKSNQTIKVDNPSTGYIVDVLLESFILKGEEVVYSIKPFFTSYPTASPAQEYERIKAYEGSYYHFIRHLINNSYKKAGYTVNIVSQNTDGSLRVIAPGLKSTLIKSDEDKHQLSCAAMIQVSYKYEDDLLSERASLGGDLSGLGQAAEVDMMSQEKKNLKAATSHQVSYIFLPSSKASLDKDGYPIRSNSIVFLGYWNNEGLADLLPRNIQFNK